MSFHDPHEGTETREKGNMPRPLPRWLFVLIGLIIIVVVGSIVLFAINVSKQKGVNAADGTTFTTASNKAVFLILMENHNWSDIKNSPSAPYINKTLLPMASYAEQYFNPPGIHPSEPNYLWLEAGTNFGIYNDADPARNHLHTSAHLVALLDKAGVSWKAYQEAIT